MGKHLSHRPAIRQLQDRLNAEHADHLCYAGFCPHDTPPAALPSGVVGLVAYDYSPRRHVVVLVRYTRRDLGGWNAVRADNGRLLGWMVRASAGEYAGQWSAHIASGAFRGDGPDDEGDVMDQVDKYLHNGGSDSLSSRAIEYCENRERAADAIVSQLVREHAPAVGYPQHPGVKPYRTRASQHFEINGRCVCGEPVDCPDRARLLAQEA